MGRPLIVDWPTRYKRGTGNISILAFAAIVISLAGGASFVATTLIQGPFPGISHLGPAQMFEGIWAAIFFSMVAGALFFSARASRRITSHMEYECGSKITAIYAAEDILIKGLLASELLRRSSDAVSRKIVSLTRHRYEPRAFIKMHVQSVVQLIICLFTPFLMFYLLPPHRTQEFAQVAVLAGTVVATAVVTHLFPNPYFEWMAASITETLAALIRGLLALTRLALCGIEVVSLPFRTFVIAKPGLHGEDVRMVETGYSTLSAHSQMLRHPDVVKTVVQVFNTAA